MRVVKSASETDGRSLEMEWELAPQSGGTPLHVHPHASESYEVLEGKLDVNVAGAWHTLSEGERRVVQAGVPHTFRNPSSGVTRVYNTHQPAMAFGEYFAKLESIANSGAVKDGRVSPKALLMLAVLMTSHEDEIRSVQPPHFVMRILAFFGRMLGFGVQESERTATRDSASEVSSARTPRDR